MITYNQWKKNAESYLDKNSHIGDDIIVTRN